MTGFSAAELLARHNIAYRQTRTGKYSTACPDCNGQGYLERHRSTTKACNGIARTVTKATANT